MTTQLLIDLKNLQEKHKLELADSTFTEGECGADEFSDFIHKVELSQQPEEYL